jgi:MOSC domain-containing protein YiiM
MLANLPRLLGIQTGRVAPLSVGGELPRVLSGIKKTPVSTLDNPLPVIVGRLGLAGDEQSDLTVHGGLEKAVYAYPVEHYAFWNAHRRETDPGATDLAPGGLGENLLLQGLTEADVHIGDELAIGDCRLVVESPRRPCEKFNLHLGSRTAARAMVQSGFSGWYLSVATGGALRAGDTVTLVPGPRLVSLVERQRQMFRRADLL